MESKKHMIAETLRSIEHTANNNKSMVYIGYNEDDKNFMSYFGNSEELVNLVARAMVHICESCKCPLDEVIDAVRKYMEKWEEEKNEIRD